MTQEPTTPGNDASDAAARFCARLTRLEEGQAFSEHAGDALTRQISELEKRLSETATRVRHLEARIGAFHEAIERREAGNFPSDDA